MCAPACVVAFVCAMDVQHVVRCNCCTIIVTLQYAMAHVPSCVGACICKALVRRGLQKSDAI